MPPLARVPFVPAQNRIRKDMLSDLTKDILQEMGIAVMGDVLAVMRQARIILHREKRASRSMGKVRGMNFAKAVQGHLQAREVGFPRVLDAHGRCARAGGRGEAVLFWGDGDIAIRSG